MARIPIRGMNHRPEEDVYFTPVETQITAATAPSIGKQFAELMADGGSDVGFYDDFKVPPNYSSGGKIVITGVLDGAPGAADTLGFGIRGRAVADNESADGTYGTEDAASVTIGSNDLGYSDEDLVIIEITLSNLTFAASEAVFYYFFIDTSGTTFTGNFLLTKLELDYTAA